jgi:hypothetical protein
MPMKPPRPDLYSERVIFLAWRFVSFPFVVAAAVFRSAKRLIRGLQSDKTLRETDQVRQSRARRELRGLAPDHDAAGTSPRQGGDRSQGKGGIAKQ